MDIEGSAEKKRGIDLEDSPFGHVQMVKLEGIEPSLSYISLDLFHINSAKKEEKVEFGDSSNNLFQLNWQLAEVISELQSILDELKSEPT